MFLIASKHLRTQVSHSNLFKIETTVAMETGSQRERYWEVVGETTTLKTENNATH